MSTATAEAPESDIIPEGEKPLLAVLDYGMGNLRSVCRAWEEVGARVQLVHEPSQIGKADGLVFPGQGAITDCMTLLHETGFDNTIRDWIQARKPFFGICLGLQALFEKSEEGHKAGLGVFKGEVVRFRLPKKYKIPHMGWNQAEFVQRHPVDKDLSSKDDQFYFVHSYYVQAEQPEIIWCETEYGIRFTSGIAYENCFATQFHPEKSQAKGLQIYRNFLEWLNTGVLYTKPQK